jgi:heptosyltransferase-2
VERRYPERLLVIRVGDLGDVLLAEPALRSLRDAFPEAEIDLLTRRGVEPLVEMMGLDLRIIPLAGGRTSVRRAIVAQTQQLLELRRRRYSRVVLLHHLTTARGALRQQLLVRATGAPMRVGLDNGRGWALTHRVSDLGFGARHEVEYALAVAQAAGGTGVPAAPALKAADVHSGGAPGSKRIVLYPAVGAYSLARAWQAARYGELAAMLLNEGHSVSIVGADDARDAARVITGRAPSVDDRVGEFGIPALAAFVRDADLVIGGDSFIGHLAAAVGTPTVTVFGPSNAAAWQPVGGHVVQANLPCQPCLYTGFRLGRPQGCPDRTCMQHIQATHVFTSAQSILAVSGNERATSG